MIFRMSSWVQSVCSHFHYQFIAPISNKRLDDYGGNLKNRCKFPFQVATKIRKIWPKDKILGARITGIDHLKDGININDSIYLVKNFSISI